MGVFKKENHLTTVSEHINHYLEYLTVLKYSPKSIDSYKWALSRFDTFLTARNIERIQDVSSKDVKFYSLVLIDQDYSVHSICLYLRSVRKLFSYLEKTKRIFVNPTESMIVTKPVIKLKPVLTQEQVQRLLAQPDVVTAAGIRNRAIIETFYSTGMRRNELIGLNVGDVDLRCGRATITGKGNKQRVVPIGKQAVFWMDKYLRRVRSQDFWQKDQNALWLGANGHRINHRTVWGFIHAYGKKAGIRYTVSPHSLRRACATHMLFGGAHPVQIQMLLGHACLQSLGQYLKVAVTDLMKTHAKASPGK